MQRNFLLSYHLLIINYLLFCCNQGVVYNTV